MTDFTGTDPVKWAKEAIRKVNAAPRMVAEEMANLMATGIPDGGSTPIRTGNLSRSVTISTSPITRDGPGYHSPVRQNYTYAVRFIKGDSTTYIAYKADYARSVNYPNMYGDGYAFLERNAAKFPQVVARVVSKLKYED